MSLVPDAEPATEERARRERLLTLERALAGALAGGISRVFTAPIDRVKLLFQVDARASGFTLARGARAARAIVRD